MTIKAPFWHPALMSGFLLDWDGVLANTKLDFSGLRERHFGGRGVMLLEEAQKLPQRDREVLLKDLRELEMKGAASATPVPGAQELLLWLEASSIPFAVVSRNCMESIELAAEKCAIRLPENVFARDSGGCVKPDPKALTEAACAISVRANECVFVGDFLYDLQGARRAGMRALLVERAEHTWQAWCDVEFATVADLVAALETPERMTPWEYDEIMARKGEKWLSRVYELTLALPDSTSPNLDSWLLRAAALGIGAISVPKEALFGPEEWKHSPSFPVSAMGMPLEEVARTLLEKRYPLARVTVDAEDGIKAPKNSLDLMRFIERKIY